MKMKQLILFLYLGSLSISLSCCVNKKGMETNKEKEKVLMTDNVIKTVSYKDLFSKIEIIPLETNTCFLITNIDKAAITGDTLILFDMFQSKVGIFNIKGEFIQLIGTRGQGPEEYLSIYDFTLKPQTNIISLLSPFGKLHNFHLTGEFVGNMELPAKHNYFACDWINERDIILWSAVEEDESGLTIYNTSAESIINENWHNDRMLDMQRLKPFFKYDDTVYFGAPLSFSVYEISTKGVKLSYTWDFNGKYISESYIEKIKQIEDPREKNERLIEDIKNGNIEIPLFNGENNEYYYIAIGKGIGEFSEVTNIFYSKNSDKIFSFLKFKEGLSLKPLYMNEEYILGIIPNEDYEVYNDILGSNIVRKEDDNPVLVRFFFY